MLSLKECNIKIPLAQKGHGDHWSKSPQQNWQGGCNPLGKMMGWSESPQWVVKIISILRNSWNSVEFVMYQFIVYILMDWGIHIILKAEMKNEKKNINID